VEERALIMELVEGKTLSGPLPIETALNSFSRANSSKIPKVFTIHNRNPLREIAKEAAADIALFRNSENHRHMWYTCPDAILHDSTAVRLIVEIEEAGEGFRPGHLFGKFYSATHARFLITRVGLTLRLSRVTFIQVVNTCALKAKSRKG